MNACAWCKESRGHPYFCTQCDSCGRKVHGAEAFRTWVTQEQFEAKQFSRGRPHWVDPVDATDKLVCGNCVHARREYRSIKDDRLIPVDELGRVLEDQPCVCCSKPTRGYIWEQGRMRFDCAECFESLSR